MDAACGSVKKKKGVVTWSRGLFVQKSEGKKRLMVGAVVRTKLDLSKREILLKHFCLKMVKGNVKVTLKGNDMTVSPNFHEILLYFGAHPA